MPALLQVASIVVAAARGPGCSSSVDALCEANEEATGGAALLQAANLLSRDAGSSEDIETLDALSADSWEATPSSYCSKSFQETVYPARTTKTLDQCKAECIADRKCVAITHANLTGIVENGQADTCMICTGTDTQEWPSWSTTYILSRDEANGDDSADDADGGATRDDTPADDAGTGAVNDDAGTGAVNDDAGKGDIHAGLLCKSKNGDAFDNVCLLHCNDKTGDGCISQCSAICATECGCYQDGSWLLASDVPSKPTADPNSPDPKPTKPPSQTKPPPGTPTRRRPVTTTNPPRTDPTKLPPVTTTAASSSENKCKNKKDSVTVGWCRKNCKMQKGSSCHKQCKKKCTAECSCNAWLSS